MATQQQLLQVPDAPTPDPRCVTVFVYGTLKRQRGNHHWMEDARGTYMGDGTLTGYTMHNLGFYPGLVPGGSGLVLGEVYSVPSDRMHILDQLEGAPRFYHQENVTLDGGTPAVVYVLTDPERYAARPVVPEGRW